MKSALLFELLVITIAIAAFKVWAPTHRELNDGKYNKLFYIFGLLLIATWLVNYFPVAFSSSHMPDEGLFLAYSSHSMEYDGVTVSNLLFHKNHLGYGGLWWAGYDLIVWITSSFSPYTEAPSSAMEYGEFRHSLLDVISSGGGYGLTSILIMRAAAISMALIFSLRLLRRSLANPWALLSLVCLVTMPLMYWSGKLASPEFFSAFLLALSVLGYFESKKIVWVFFVGVACGIKLTCAPVGAVLIMFATFLSYKKHGLSGAAYAGIISVLGFITSNAYILIHPVSFFDAIYGVVIRFANSPVKYYLMGTPQLIWDGGTYGTLSYWFGSGVAFCFILILSFLANFKVGLFFAISTLAMLLFMLAQPIHNWYWFPVVVVSVIPFALVEKHEKVRRRILLVGYFFAILYNSYFAIQSSMQEIEYRKDQLAEIHEYRDAESCLRRVALDNNPDVIYDMAAIGKKLALYQGQKREGYLYSFNNVGVKNKSETKVLAVFGLRATNFPHIKNFLQRGKSSGALIGNCGRTQWVIF